MRSASALERTIVEEFGDEYPLCQRGVRQLIAENH